MAAQRLRHARCSPMTSFTLALLLPLALVSLPPVVMGQSIPTTFSWASVGSFANHSSACAFPILNQQQCGGCYAFSTAATVGVSLCAYTGNPAWLGFSPQEVLNTNYQDQSPSTWSNNNNPCNGGFPIVMVYFLAQEAHEGAGFGMCAPAAAPSTDDLACEGGCSACAAGCLPFTEGNCVEDSNEPIGAQFSESSCVNDACVCNAFAPATSCSSSSSSSSSSAAAPSILTPLSLPGGVSFGYQAFSSADFLTAPGRLRLKQWLMSHGPISIGMDAGDTFTAGTGAAAASCADCAGQPNHAVTIMGWAPVGGAPAWIVQNSWGQWGDGGLFYIPMASVGSGSGQFNIAIPTGVRVFHTAAGGGTTEAPPPSYSAQAAQSSTSAAPPPPSSSTHAPSPHPATSSAPVAITSAATTTAAAAVASSSTAAAATESSAPTQAPSETTPQPPSASTTATADTQPSSPAELDVSRFGPLPHDVTHALGGLHYRLGSRMPVVNRTHSVARVLGAVLHSVNSRLAAAHNISAVQRLSRQVVNGVLYASTLLVANAATNHTRRVQSTVFVHPARAGQAPALRVVSLHISHPITALAAAGTSAAGAGGSSSSASSSSSSSSSSSRLGLGLGLGLGLAVAAAVAVVAVVAVMRQRAAVRKSSLKMELLEDCDQVS